MKKETQKGNKWHHFFMISKHFEMCSAYVKFNKIGHMYLMCTYDTHVSMQRWKVSAYWIIYKQDIYLKRSLHTLIQ